MTPEEISVNENFWYPLYLLLIGGGLSVGLIKLFNFLHEIKLRNLEVQREESQKRIDREREDIRFSFEIKERIIEKDSERYTWFGEKFIELCMSENDGKHTSLEIDKLYQDTLSKLTMRNVPIANLLVLYIQDKKLDDLNFELFSMMNSAFSIAATKPSSVERRELINGFLKKFNITLEDDKIEEAVTYTGNSFEPAFLISGKSGDVTREILNSKIHFHYSKT